MWTNFILQLAWLFDKKRGEGKICESERPYTTNGRERQQVQEVKRRNGGRQLEEREKRDMICVLR